MKTAGRGWRRGGRRRLAALCVAVALLTTSCETVEKVLPYAVVAGGAILSVVALNYVGDCSGGDTWYNSCDASGEVTAGYREQVLLMISTLTTVGGAAADAWSESREKQRELAKLEAAEQQVDTQYANLEASQPPAAQSWASAYGTPPAGPAEPARWGNVAPTPAYGSGYAQPAPGPPPGMGGAPGGMGGPPQGMGGPPATAAAGPGGGPAGGSQNPWGEQYASRGAPASLGVDVALLKRVLGADGHESMAAIADGEVLFDGRGETREDRFRVFVSPSEDAYLYVVAVDALGRVQPLFPRRYPDRSNPIRAGERILLPDDQSWYGLDEYTGLQHVYVYASRTAQVEFEKQLTLFASAAPPAPPGSAHSVSEPTLINSRGLQARGLTGVVPGDVVRMPGDVALEFQPTRVLASAADQGVVATRYFDHR